MTSIIINPLDEVLPLINTLYNHEQAVMKIACNYSTLCYTAPTLTHFCRIMKKSSTAIYGLTSLGCHPSPATSSEGISHQKNTLVK